MDKPVKKTSPGTVVGGQTSKISKKTKLFGLGSLLLVVIVVIVTALLLRNKPNSYLAADGHDTRDDTVNSAFTLAKAGKNSDAKAKLESVFKKVKTKEDKAYFLDKKYTLCLQIKDYKCAKDALKGIESITGASVTLLIKQASIARIQGDTAGEMQLLEQALSEAKHSNDVDKQASIDDITERLGGAK